MYYILLGLFYDPIDEPLSTSGASAGKDNNEVGKLLRAMLCEMQICKKRQQMGMEGVRQECPHRSYLWASSCKA